MHAYEIPGLRYSMPAGADISRRRFVTVNTSSAAVYPAAGKSVIGVSMDDATEGNVLTIADGIVMIEAAAAIAAGDEVATDATGKAIKVAGEALKVGIAFTDATVANQIIVVKIG